MGYRKKIVALFFVCAWVAAATAQSPKPSPASTASVANQPALAFVNNQPITLSDLDPEVRQMVDNLDKEIADARRKELDNEISTILIETEAAKRKVTVEQLLEAEVLSRVTEPTNAEIQAVYDQNREKLGTATLETVRPQIVAYLRNQRTQKLVTDLVTRLRATINVAMGASDVNATAAPSTVFATVAGRTITAGQLEEQAKPQIYDLRMKVYEAEKSAVDVKINDLLLAAEAKRRGVTEQDLLRTEVIDKVRPTTDADVTKFYEENKARITGDLAARRADIQKYLEQQEQDRAARAFVDSLRGGASVRLLLVEPEPPVQAISTDDDPSRGDPKAPVTVVMFTDFQCPSCAAMHPVVDETLKGYGNRVRLVVRDYPLPMHTEARKAAEAADAANAQGKFFEYIILLYKNQSALDVPSLKKYATQAGLDRARFDRELDGGIYAAEVTHDIADGEKYGVTATPTIFINGVRLREVSAEAFKTALERAFVRVNRPAASTAK
jgi:protein-disulfide isomerase